MYSLKRQSSTNGACSIAMMKISGGYVPLLNLAQIYCEDVTSLNTLWYEDILSGGSMLELLDGLQYLQAMVIHEFRHCGSFERLDPDTST